MKNFSQDLKHITVQRLSHLVLLDLTTAHSYIDLKMMSALVE